MLGTGHLVAPPRSLGAAAPAVSSRTHPTTLGVHMSELGEFLRSARLKKEVSVERAAAATRIKPSYLEALEDGDYQLLPGPAYITGFLRNYAGYLGLHPDDVVQEYYSEAPALPPSVRAVGRILANGHQRQHRLRLLWGLAGIMLLLAAGYAVKQYNDTYAHPYSPPLLTPANLGAPESSGVRHRAPVQTVSIQLRALAPVWIRVTADHQRVFQGILRPAAQHRSWTAHHSIYVVTYDGAHLWAAYDGKQMGRMAQRPGLIVDLATPASWQRVS